MTYRICYEIYAAHMTNAPGAGWSCYQQTCTVDGDRCELDKHTGALMIYSLKAGKKHLVFMMAASRWIYLELEKPPEPPEKEE
jgi:hypothetical protein